MDLDFQELRWFDISMYDPMFVHRGKGFEHRSKVYLDVVYVHSTIERLHWISPGGKEWIADGILENLGAENEAVLPQLGPDVWKQ